MDEEMGYGYRIRLDTVMSGFMPGQDYCWVHGRAGAIPGDMPVVVMTMQQLALGGSDVFGPLNELRTDDMGTSWRGPYAHDRTLGRRDTPSGLQIGVCDFTPAWHKKTGLLLGTGHTVAYHEGDRGPRPHDRQVAYSIYDQEQGLWSSWQGMGLPSEVGSAGAGCSQRVDLEDGTILLPVYGKPDADDQYYTSTVLKCQFDGQTLHYIGHGSSLTCNRGRGYYEPSLTRYGDRFLVTLRADDCGAVASSEDGLHYTEPQLWTWDDGSQVPTYNTQQHWVTHSDALYLVYTRIASDNGHVFRHRAPLYIAEVDPDRLCLIKETERVLIPERGARLGNFGVVHVNESETWVTVCEWMQNGGQWGKEMWRKLKERYSVDELAQIEGSPHMSKAVARYGADNAIYVARIQWERPNAVVA